MEEYWGSDFKPLCKEMASALSENIKRGKKKDTERIILDFLKKKNELSIIGSGRIPRDDSWKNNLDEKEISYLEPRLTEIRESLDDDEPSIKKILSASIPFEIQKKCIEMFDVLQNYDRYTEEYVEYRERIKKLIKEHELSKESLEKFNFIKEEKYLSMEDRILQLETTDQIRSKIYSMWKQLMNESSESSTVDGLRRELEYTVSLPYNRVTKTPEIINIAEYLTMVKQRLDEKLFGMDNVKDHILEILNNRFSSREFGGMCLGLIGEPGTGKTSVAEAIAYAMDLPFGKVSLGGSVDAGIVKGNGKVWIGSEPGAVSQFMIQSKSSNGVFLFDEVDKLCSSEKGKEVENALLHISDYTHNNKFKDNFFTNIDIDLSRMWFVFCMNSKEGMSKALLDRLTIIEVENYSFAERCKITTSYIIPKIFNKIGIKEGELTFTDQAISQICLRSNEGGMRNIEKYIFGLISKINLKRRFDENYSFPFIINEGVVRTMQVTKSQRDKIPFGMYS